MSTVAASPDPELREAAKQVASLWWIWLAAGIAWIFAALVILQFDQASITTISVILGIMFAGSAVQQFVIGAIAERGRWLFICFGVLFAICSVVCFVNPKNTFAGLADVLGFLFMVVGVWWTVRAFMTQDLDRLWWVGLIAGILMVLLAFWTSGQLLIHKAYTLLVFAGIWAMLHGVTDIIRAFQVRAVGKEL